MSLRQTIRYLVEFSRFVFYHVIKTQELRKPFILYPEYVDAEPRKSYDFGGLSEF